MSLNMEKQDYEFSDYIFHEIYEKYLKDKLYKLTDLTNAYKMSNMLNMKFVYSKFVSYKLNSKKYPNITVDFRIKKMSENVYKVYFVYPGINVYTVDERSARVVRVEDNKFLITNEEVFDDMYEKLERLEKGNEYFNVIDLGTYDVITFGEYIPSDNKFIVVTKLILTELLSFRRTDLGYNIDKVTTKLLQGNEEQRIKIISYVEKFIGELVTEYISHIVTQFIPNSVPKTRTINISITSNINGFFLKYKRIIVNGYAKSQNSSEKEYIYESYEKARLFVDRLMTSFFMNVLYNKFKEILTKLKMMYIITYDMNYWNYSSIHNDVDADLIQKCYESVFIGAKCIRRQTYDVIKLLLNERVEKKLKEIIYDKSAQSAYYDKYSLKFIKEKDYPVNMSDIIRVYQYLRKKDERMEFVKTWTILSFML